MHHKLDPIKALIQLSRLLPKEATGEVPTLARALKHIAICCGADRAFISLWDDQAQTIQTLDQWQIEQLEAMPTNVIHIDEYLNLDEYFEQNKGMCTLQRVSIIHDHKLVGMLSLESRDPINHLNQDERQFVNSASQLLGPHLVAPRVRTSLGDSLDTVESSGDLSVREQEDWPNVLVVEDNKINQLTIAKMIQRCGANAFTADDGLEGIKACKRRKFDLILMDLSMPNLDGFDTTREILTTCDLNKKTPIVAITANVGHGVDSRCFKVGMTEYVAKPVRWNRMRELLEKYLQVSGEKS